MCYIFQIIYIRTPICQTLLMIQTQETQPQTLISISLCVYIYYRHILKNKNPAHNPLQNT